jgi:hypothetical protein
MFTAFSMLVGCSDSGEKRDYRVPSALCGVAVAPEIVSALLPPGERLSFEEKRPVHRRAECRANVDGQVALIVSQEWWEDSDTLVDVAASVPQLESAVLSDDSNTYMNSPTGAVMKASGCDSPDHPGHSLFTALEVHADGVDNAEATKKLITTYTQAVEDSDTCR